MADIRPANTGGTFAVPHGAKTRGSWDTTCMICGEHTGHENHVFTPKQAMADASPPTETDSTEVLSHKLDCSTWKELRALVDQMRDNLRTEQEMHAAWRKRAMEAEADIQRLKQSSEPDGCDSDSVAYRDAWQAVYSALGSPAGGGRTNLEGALSEVARLQARHTEPPAKQSYLSEIDFLEQWLQFACTPVGQECCNRPGSECCGSPNSVYPTLDQVTNAMNARRSELVSALSLTKGDIA